jgi:hypothetical protein
MFGDVFSNASVVAKLSLLVVMAPLPMGILYAVRPSEARLALMRPLSLAGIFAGLCGFGVGVINVLIGASRDTAGWSHPGTFIGLSEALVPLVIGFACLTVAWLCVALGMRRGPA